MTGLRANLPQFTLLVVVNGFVGATVGLERAVLPLLGELEFGVGSRTALLAFLVSFGVVKALANLAAGGLADRVGRRRLLLLGWLVGLPVPAMVWFAPTWGWIAAANVLLGAQQGLCWSTAVMMKIDLAGPRRRGLAMGLNEAAGYGAVALASLASGWAAGAWGMRPALVVLGAGFAAVGLGLSLFVRDTAAHVASEGGAPALPFREVLARTSGGDRALTALAQAGFVNNMNDGLAWGLFPLLFAAAGLGLHDVGLLVAAYPAAWGIAQLGTGALSDSWGRRPLIAGGMAVQAAALAAVAVASGFHAWLAASILLGLGTAMVYPTLLAAVGDVAAPSWRAPAVGAYRLWRDLGYAAGAILSGLVADALDLEAAILVVAALTLASGAWAGLRLRAPLSSLETA